MSYDSEVLADSPLIYLPMQETSGTSAADSSGNSRNMTIVGSIGLNATKVMPTSARAFDFPASTASYLSLVTAAWMQVSSFSIEAWIRMDTSTSYKCIWSRDSTGGGTRGPSFYVTSGKLNLFGTADHLGTTTLATGTDYHVVATYDSSTSTVKFYINGSLDATLTSVSITNSGAFDMFFGASHAATVPLNFPFDGRIEHGAYYGSVLSATRVAAHYAAGTGILPASGSASLSLTASGGAAAASGGSAALSLTASGGTSAPAGGSASLSLSATGALVPPTPASGAASLSLTAAGGASGSPGGTASLSLAATGAAFAVLAASGSATLSLTATGSAVMSTGGTATLTLSAGGVALVLYGTDTSNAFDGLDVVCVATVTITRPAAAAPPGLVPAMKYDKAVPYPAPVMVGGRPT